MSTAIYSTLVERRFLFHFYFSIFPRGIILCRDTLYGESLISPKIQFSQNPSTPITNGHTRSLYRRPLLSEISNSKRCHLHLESFLDVIRNKTTRQDAFISGGTRAKRLLNKNHNLAIVLARMERRQMSIDTGSNRRTTTTTEPKREQKFFRPLVQTKASHLPFRIYIILPATLAPPSFVDSLLLLLLLLSNDPLPVYSLSLFLSVVNPSSMGIQLPDGARVALVSSR